jgi:electron transfer flavoprotein beta subunit
MIVEMDLTNDIEIAKIKFPCLIAVDKDIYVPRLPSYVRKQETRDREIKVLTLQDMEDRDEKNYGLNGSPTQVERIFPPRVNTCRETWEGTSQELTGRLFSKLCDLKFI